MVAIESRPMYLLAHVSKKVSVETLKIKPYNEKVPHPESLDTMSAIRLDLRRANKLNYNGIQTLSVLGAFRGLNGDHKLSRGVNL